MPQHLLLAIDDQALPLIKNTCLYLSQPTVRAAPVLLPAPQGSGAPDDQAAHFYGTVLYDEGKYRMWYYACHWGINPDWPPRMMQQVKKSPPWASGAFPLQCGPLCYAESDDGLTFTKPALGQVLFKGSRANNALAIPHTVIGGVLVLRDDTDPDASRRYKMVYQYFPDQCEPPIPEFGSLPSVALAVSPDGLHWTPAGMPFINQFVEPSSLIHHQGQYILHYHVAESWGYCSEGGGKCGRTGVARLSPDFVHWPDLIAPAFALAEPEDRNVRGINGPYDQVHLGVGATSFGNVCVGLYGLWHNAHFNADFAKISCDFGLLVSTDGVQFREPVKGHRFIRREDSLATPVPGKNYHTVLCQANGILNVGNETRIYHGRWRNVGGTKTDDALQDYSGEVALATLPRDRWGARALMPGTTTGAVVTAPLAIPRTGAAFTLNAEGVAGLRVALWDAAALTPLPGYEQGVVVGGDGLDCPVQWPGHALTELAGRTVRFAVHFTEVDGKSPRLYAAMLNGK